MNALSLDNISHSYEANQILDGLSLSVAQGAFVSLIGPSGSGKSTVLRLVAGLEELQAGALHIDGKDMSQIGPANRGVGMVFQYPSLFPHLDVAENITFGIRKQPKQEQRASTVHWLEALGLKGYEARYPHQLSGGEQQRVALARTLVMKPKILLLDEPFANLDALLRKTMRDEVLELLKQQKITTMLVTHDPAEALAVSDKIAVLNGEGKLLQYGTAEDLRTLPKDEFVSTLLAAA